MSQPSNVLAYLAKDFDLEGYACRNAAADIASNQVAEQCNRRSKALHALRASLPRIMARRLILQAGGVGSEMKMRRYEGGDRGGWDEIS
jgi:hypothetical protein